MNKKVTKKAPMNLQSLLSDKFYVQEDYDNFNISTVDKRGDSDDNDIISMGFELSSLSGTCTMEEVIDISEEVHGNQKEARIAAKYLVDILMPKSLDCTGIMNINPKHAPYITTALNSSKLWKKVFMYTGHSGVICTYMYTNKPITHGK